MTNTMRLLGGAGITALFLLLLKLSSTCFFCLSI